MSDNQSNTAEKIDLSGATGEIALWIAEFDGNEMGDRPIRWARHAILDWLGVTLAGAHEPLVDILTADAVSEGESGTARLVGRHQRLTPSFAAMINGAASHALDYDDVNKRLHGHPTAPVVPAILALAEQHEFSGRAVLEAFVVGYEVECLIGEMMGLAHYDHGWHATATVGTFGAAAGSARLLGLNAEQAAMAMGLAATQAAGLKSMFGTMCKPLHAGKAAMNGMMAARLAKSGFDSRPDALECPQGFGATQSTEFQALPMRPDATAPFAVEENLFKYHAACYLTHSSVEAIRVLKESHDFDVSDIAAIRTLVDAGHGKVCDIPEPTTGLEVKFSIRHMIAMALAGEDTAAMETYSAEFANRDDLVDLRRKVQVETRTHDSRHAAEIVIDLNDGRSLVQFYDVGVPADDVDGQEQRLIAKFHQLAEPVIGKERAEETVALVQALDGAESIVPLLVAVD
ncbi:MAG: MmgE/PrpD family protein [Rhodospirillaceae bacterium]|nr:MmgE/PrpD family protein [Rhodospirillaceae bacterium]MBT5515371.1 MmgE/PrpD family protein [Rhodospirillaceae bacterium]MBT6085978.1 MmgE/PrpD family protein [Rhodospirillaceae bacterium]MBT6607793.1 MmgE/PrpD family protein [Rhodospirillaceae bacterium]MBT7248890.1 MmgE/PrpD family protein [Rhodospirillaceae bacterium]